MWLEGIAWIVTTMAVDSVPFAAVATLAGLLDWQ